MYFYFQNATEDNLNTCSSVQHEAIIHEADTGATEIPNALMDVHDEQADIIEAPVVTSNPTGSATLEPIITPCSEQVTLRADLNQLIIPLMYFAQLIFIESARLQYFRPALF